MTKKIMLTLLGLVMLPALAQAHKVNVFCHAEGQMLVGEGYFSGGRPAKGAQVEVIDTDRQEVMATTLTDEQGQFSIPWPSGETFRVVLNAGQGHRAEFLITRQPSASKPDLRENIQEKEKPVPVPEQEKNEISWRDVVSGLALIIGIFCLIAVGKKNAS